MQVAQEPPRGVPADERLGRRPSTAGGISATAGPAALVDGVVELGRLGQRTHAQLAVEHPHALAVLAHGVAAAAAGRVPLDQPPVGGLVQRIEREALLGAGHGVVVASGRGQRIDQAVERRRPLAADALGGELLPVVEGGAVADGEALQQVAAVQVRPPRRAPLAVAAGSAAVRRNSARSNQASSRSIAIELRSAVSAAAVERGPQRRERASQRRPRAVDVELRPEQRRHHLTALRVSGHRQVGEHRRRLARIDPKRAALDFDHRRAEK